MVNIGNVWDRTTEFLSDNIVAWLPIAATAVLVPESVAGLVRGAGPAVNSRVALLVAIVCMLVSLWGQLTIVALSLDPDSGRSRAVAVATARFPRAIAAALLVLAVILVLIIPLSLFLSANGIDMSGSNADNNTTIRNLSGGARTFVIVYFLAWLIGTYIVWARLWLLNPVIVSEGGVIAGLRRAFALGRGLTWKLIGVSLLFVLVTIVAWFAATSAIGAVVGLLDGNPSPFAVGRWIVSIAGGLVATAFYVVVAAFSAKLYRAATPAREGAAAA